MRVSLSKVRSGIALAAEIVQAADQARNGNGRTTRAELLSILDAEGYGPGHPMRAGVLAMFDKAMSVAGGKAPTAAEIMTAARRTGRTVAEAARQDGAPRAINNKEFDVLSPRMQRAVEFARKYGSTTLDQHFF